MFRLFFVILKRLPPGVYWLRRGLQSKTGHAEDQLPRKYIWNLVVANDETYALAA